MKPRRGHRLNRGHSGYFYDADSGPALYPGPQHPHPHLGLSPPMAQAAESSNGDTGPKG